MMTSVWEVTAVAIIFSKSCGTITLHTRNSTYQMKVTELGYLLHIYYGARIMDEDISYLVTHYDRGFSPNPNGAGNDRTISLDVMPQEFSSAGVGDFRVSSIEVENGDGSRAFEGKYTGHRIYSGKYRLEGLPGLRVRDADTVDTLEIDIKDAVTGLKVTLCYSVFEDLDVITRAARVSNEGALPIQLKKIMSVTMDYLEADYDFIHFDGRHTMEREMHRDRLTYGQHEIGSIRGTSSHQHNPFVIVCDHGADEDVGGCYGFSFVYSGNFMCAVQKDQFDQTRLVMGIHPDRFSWQLRAGETFEAPEVVMAYSGEGLTRLSHIYHDVYRNNLNDSRFMQARRPVLINSWEAAYFNFNHEKLVAMARDARALGVDLFVLDDGWFGSRNDDTSALGDWDANTDKLPRGLKGLVDDINAMGMDFGIWVEPEMVSEHSLLYHEHPDWSLKIPHRPVTRGRYQLVLDLSRQDVQEYIISFMDKLLSSANITYVKWDMNRSISEIWSCQAANGRDGVFGREDGVSCGSQGEVFHKYILGLYAVLDRLVHAHPRVLFEGCSGGGGRFDAGMLYYHPQIWCSDNTDAINRLKIQYGTSFGYPVSAMGAHVSICPNHQTGRSVPLSTRGTVAMGGTFGFELDPGKMTAAEIEECRSMTEKFRQYSDLIFKGDYYRLESPYSDKGFTAWAFVSKDKREALASVVVTDKEPNDAQRYLKLRGLEKNTYYRVEGFDGCWSGAALMRAGIPLSIYLGEYASVQYYIRAAQ